MKKREKDKTIAGRMVSAGRGAVCGSLGLVVLVGLAMLFPMSNNSHAVVEDEFSGNVHTDIKTYVRSTIALAVSGQVNFDLVPKASGTFGTGTAELSVATNNVSGYSVYLAMVDSNSNSLLPMNTRSTEEIVATPATLTATNYANYLNTWGYMVGQDVGYKAVPKTASAPIITEDVNAKEMSYDLSFAVAVGTDLPAGVYGNQVLVSAVANPIEIRGINDITLMQEMTSDICTVSFEGETKRLIDSRDGKLYWVAKLKDGNCWMTQNLALDITEAGLSASDTDIEEDWNQDSEFPPAKTNAVAFLGSAITTGASASSTNSWNLGEVVLGVVDNKNTLCGSRGGEMLSGGWNYNSLISTDDFATRCGNSTFVNVDGWADTFVAQEGALTTPNDKSVFGVVSVDEDKKTYDAHYLVGNYYQWNAATAGTGVNASASGSACPKGWKLPESGSESGSLSGSFGYLINQYGFNVNPGVGDKVEKGAYHFARKPFYYVKTGKISLDIGYLTEAGANTFIWSKNMFNNNQAYEIFVNMNNVYLPVKSNMSYGLSVRCVAR